MQERVENKAPGVSTYGYATTLCTASVHEYFIKQPDRIHSTPDKHLLHKQAPVDIHSFTGNKIIVNEKPD
ncbi:MAG: hypothetical protein WD035_08000, partial [Balneolaceae bacterium]